MRPNLADLAKFHEKRVTVQGSVRDFGATPRNRRLKPTIVLVSVTLPDDTWICGLCWFTYGKRFRDQQLQVGAHCIFRPADHSWALGPPTVPYANSETRPLASTGELMCMDDRDTDVLHVRNAYTLLEPSLGARDGTAILLLIPAGQRARKSGRAHEQWTYGETRSTRPARGRPHLRTRRDL